MRLDLTSLQRERLEAMEANGGLAYRDSRNRWTIGAERVTAAPMVQLLRRGLITAGPARDHYRDYREPREYVLTADGGVALMAARGEG